MEETKLTSKQFLNELTAKHYDGALQAKAEGKPVAWAVSISPQELFETLDMHVVYPENHAAAIGARKEAMKFIDHAEGIGYSADICSYARINMAYTDIPHAEAQDIPLPDVVLCSANICTTVMKWWENLAKKLRVPLVFIDTPFNHTYEVPDHAVEYLRGQFESAIKQLEDFSGKRFDFDKLGEVMKLSNATCQWWKAATDLAQFTPSPLNGFDMFNYMAIMVCMRGNADGHKLFKLWYEELLAKKEAGLGPWSSAEEKYRIMWDGIACWPHLSTTFKTLKKYGINMVTSTYPESWNVRYETNDLTGMARAYTVNYANRNLDFGTDYLKKLVDQFNLDGVLYHSNRSCKLMDFRQYEVRRRVEAMTGIPTTMFDGDQTDPRSFSEAQYETRVQGLVEMMDKRKAAGR
ncbi:MAG: 2-hydroxyacyl-CoA dehydratase family protein [Oscillospiraceae bacterium]|nr:2-hydroxyacyl-CoA dehydratase family protein [Oscillospiraceae bacterium]